MHLVKNAMSGVGDDQVGEDKLMREIAKETQLHKNNIIVAPKNPHIT